MNDIYNRKDEEFTVIGEVPESLKLNDPLYKEGFQAGAASRDAEIAELKTVPMKYRRMAFNAQLQAEVAELAKERDQLREQVALLRSHMTTFVRRCDLGEIRSNKTYASFVKALADTEPKK